MNLYEISVVDDKGITHKSKIYEINVDAAFKEAFIQGRICGAKKLDDCTVRQIPDKRRRFKTPNASIWAESKTFWMPWARTAIAQWPLKAAWGMLRRTSKTILRSA